MGWQGSPLYAHHHVPLPDKLRRVNRTLPARKNNTMAAETSETGDSKITHEQGGGGRHDKVLAFGLWSSS